MLQINQMIKIFAILTC